MNPLGIGSPSAMGHLKLIRRQNSPTVACAFGEKQALGTAPVAYGPEFSVSHELPCARAAARSALSFASLGSSPSRRASSSVSGMLFNIVVTSSTPFQSLETNPGRLAVTTMCALSMLPPRSRIAIAFFVVEAVVESPNVLRTGELVARHAHLLTDSRTDIRAHAHQQRGRLRGRETHHLRMAS
jgi:hypothetical protein